MPIVLAAIALIGLLAALGTAVATSGLATVGNVLLGPIGWGIAICIVVFVWLKFKSSKGE